MQVILLVLTTCLGLVATVNVQSSSTAASKASSSASSGIIDNDNCCSDNEHYVNNEQICSRTCNDENVMCDTITGCVCNDGFVRNDNGDCVDLCTCPQCNEDEEYQSCGTCEDTCDDYDKTCKVCAAVCYSGCFCKADTVRATDGSRACVPICECPPRTCTGANEIYDSCPPYCQQQNCSGMDVPPNCTQDPRDCCDARCVCEPGYLRDDLTGVCVPEDQCPNSCECEDGTYLYTTGCGYLTPEATCDEPCPEEQKDGMICDYSACYCNPPTVRDTVSNKCVKVEECP